MMRDVAGNVLYVGKAASLRTRLRSYFGSPTTLEKKIRKLVTQIDDFEYLVTDTEAEALILENTLIKKHQPHYNARLKDDKTYPFIKIDLNETYPQVYLTRRVRADGARYFGPYASVGSVRTTMTLLKKLFPYRSCTKTITGKDERPCLEYFINRCVAPCTGYVSNEEYRHVVQQVILFMEGKTETVLRRLRAEMQEASSLLQFEKAAALRDQIRAVERAGEQQKMDTANRDDQDILATATGFGNETWVEVFFVRNGKLTGRNNFLMQGTQDDQPSQVLAQFIKQFYDSAAHIPRELLVQHPIGDETEVIQKWLTTKRKGTVALRVPERGRKRQLVRLAAENAAQGLTQHAIKWQFNYDNVQLGMHELRDHLSLPKLPLRVECYDISNIQGSNPVGSMVVFENGRPRNSHYRRFRIKNITGIDDYSMMQEMLRRRFKRLAETIPEKANQPDIRQPSHAPDPDLKTPTTDGNELNVNQDPWATAPDLVIIDGGKGHLSAALQVFLELGIVEHIPLSSLAKQQEELFLPHDPDPVLLPKGSQGLFLVQRIRDEAHRFAVTYHRQRRSRTSITSSLDTVPGIGPKRRRILLNKFGSVTRIKNATLDELTAVEGLTLKLATKLKEFL